MKSAKERPRQKRLRKVRVTTLIDKDVLMWLRVRAMDSRVGYQTLMNALLREAIEREGREKGVSRSEFEALHLSLKALEEKLTLIETRAKPTAAPKRVSKTKSKPMKKKVSRMKKTKRRH